MGAKPELSFEFSPVRSTAEQERLNNVVSRLSTFRPTFYSVTYGAGGTTREGTRDTVHTLRDAGFNAVPHLSWGNASQVEIGQICDEHLAKGVREFILLTGDLPSGVGRGTPQRFASDLVRYICESYRSNELCLRVGCYPESHPLSKSIEDDVDTLKRKVDAGADECITQYFYNVDAYSNFVNRCRQVRIEIPIAPGIMPISNFDTLTRFSERCGAEIPRWLGRQLKDFGDDTNGLREFGADFVAQMVESLLALGANHLHFYTLNGYLATSRILRRLGY